MSPHRTYMSIDLRLLLLPLSFPQFIPIHEFWAFITSDMESQLKKIEIYSNNILNILLNKTEVG